MAKMILICGKICCGKTTYAQKLSRRSPARILSVDEIMLALFGQHAGARHDEYAARTKSYLLEKSAELIQAGMDVILDWGFWTKEERRSVREFCAARNIACEFHYLDVSDSLWRARLEERNRAVSAGEVNAYFVDENLAAKFASRFETPAREEIDLWLRDGEEEAEHREKLPPQIIEAISDFIFVADEPQKSDVIFLPGGSNPLQGEHAAGLYRAGWAPLLFPSGGVSVKFDHWQGVAERREIYDGDYHSDCEFLTDVLKRNGVPEEAIVGEYQSRHTRDNAFLSRKVADERGIFPKKAIIACKSFHARRCLMLYSLAFPDTEFLVCPVDCYGVTKNEWFRFEKGIDQVLGELARCGNQFVGDMKNYLKGME